MPFALPHFSRSELAHLLADLAPEPLSGATLDSLYEHYLELARWNLKTSLVGPGTAGDFVSRHYGESLAALPLIPETAGIGMDLGSGAGFPGLVLAAARPRLQMALVEAREKKGSFLASASRKAALSCRCINARVALPLPSELPATVDLVTVRALKLEAGVFAALANRLTPEGRVLLWVGEDDPDWPPVLEEVTQLSLSGSRRRRILALRRIPR
jgi:16S rRNA (guanine527-N7)-methyltransferase